MTTRPLPTMFAFDHLSPELKAISAPFYQIAMAIYGLPQNGENDMALRKLLEAKDCAVRGALLGKEMASAANGQPNGPAIQKLSDGRYGFLDGGEFVQLTVITRATAGTQSVPSVFPGEETPAKPEKSQSTAPEGEELEGVSVEEAERKSEPKRGRKTQFDRLGGSS